MALEINIELGDADVEHFVENMRKAQQEAAHMTAGQITDAARKLVEKDEPDNLPAFIDSRLHCLRTMVDMAEDEGFALPEEDRSRVLAALTYFAKPADMIPDASPVLGFLDDAIMIELCRKELEYELAGYDEFAEWRRAEAAHHGVDPAELKYNRVDWAEDRRALIIQQMHNRRERSRTSGAWKPVLFRAR